MTGRDDGIHMDDYDYELPQARIAEYPVEIRDQSRLLVLNNEKPSQDYFYNVPDYLPAGSLMIFNNTRVIRARLVFHKPTGARIEIFCLEAVGPTAEISKAFQQQSSVVWKCLIGNARKWQSGNMKLHFEIDSVETNLYAERVGETEGAFLVRFSWDPPQLSFAAIIEAAGKIPLPPYIEREVEEDDASRYQTIYAAHNGSVAAPTAGLHFTDDVLKALRNKDVQFENVTLHVGAGTFKPVSHEDIRDHEMHTEQIVLRRELIQALLKNSGSVIAVGTTSMRTLESLYWFGKRLQDDPQADFAIRQWEPYEDHEIRLTANDVFKNILQYMDAGNINEISGSTGIIIVPGYKFRIVDILLTNFHMPRSTLLLLVAAFTGAKWKVAYQYALEHDFRFLSYGDSCLFFGESEMIAGVIP